jgi:hypothetical protein
MSTEKFNIKKKGNSFVAFDLVDPKVSYGSISIKTGKFVGGTRCMLQLIEHLEANKKPVNYVQSVQISLDIAIPEGLTSDDVTQFIENEVANLIHKKTKLVLLNGVYECEDMGHAYDLGEINKMLND